MGRTIGLLLAKDYTLSMSRLHKVWGLWLGLLLLLGCATPQESSLFDGVHDTPDGTWRIGRRIRFGQPKSSPTKTPAKNSTATGTNEPSSPQEPSKPATLPSRGAVPSYTLGASDGGPGQWEKTPARTKGAGYQHEVTGAPEGVEYAVPARTPSGKVLFDGYKDGKLLDAKDWEKWPPEDMDFWRQGVLDDARKQLGAARATPIEWHFPSENKAEVVRDLLDENDIKGIDVKITRKK